MLNILVKFVFTIITKLFSIIFTPIFAVLYALFPNLANVFTYISNFLGVALSYVSSITYMLFIPQACLVLFFDYLLIKYTVYLTRLTISFVARTYNLLKP